VPLLHQGRIVWVTVCDPNGENLKERPAVIIAATAEIQPNRPIAAVAITGALADPLSSDCVELPWHRNKHPRTGLKKRCAARCRWLIAVNPNDIKEYAGIVPVSKMLEILARIPRTPAPE
jgi:mRNA-degrading endonuclease toxin of MazEF toxin-antitoxin module